MTLRSMAFLSAAVLLAPVVATSQVIPPEVEWIRQFGGEGPSGDELRAVAADGAVYVAGEAGGTLPGQSTTHGVFLRRYDASGAAIWTRQFGTSGTQAIFGMAAAAGAVYVVGVTRASIGGQPTFGDSDGFVCMFTSDGDQRWCRIVGTPAFDLLDGAAADATGVYLAGHTWGTLPGQSKTGVFHDAFVQKFDPDGSVLWTRQFGSTDLARAEAIASDGAALYVAGTVRGSLAGQTPAGSTDVFVRSYDTFGTELWTRQLGTPASDSAARVGLGAGRVYVAGATSGGFPGYVGLGSSDVFLRALDPGGAELWTRQFGTATLDGVGGVAADPSGVYVTGFTWGTLPGQTTQGSQDAYLRKYDLAGTEQWTRQFGHDLSDGAFGVATDASGVYIAGQRELVLRGTATTDDAVLWKYDASGTQVWRQQFGSTGHGVDVAYGVAVRDGVFVAGDASIAIPGQDPIGGSSDAFLRKYDAHGAEVWTRQFGTTNVDHAAGVAVDASGIYVAGHTFGTLPGQTPTPLGSDAFVRKYDHAGQEVWTRQYNFTEFADDRIEAVAVDGTGVYVSGQTVLFATSPDQTLQLHLRKYDPNGIELWTRLITAGSSGGAFGIAADDTGVYLAGYVNAALPASDHLGSFDAFVRKYDPAGNELWTRQFGTSVADVAFGVVARGSRVYVTGWTNGLMAGPAIGGTFDGFVRAFDMDGTALWTRQFSTAPDSTGTAVAADASGVYVSARSGLFFDLETRDMFVHKYSTAGDPLWSRQLGTPLMDEALGLAVDVTGLYLAGLTDGLFVDQPAGFTDALVAKLMNPVSIDVDPDDPANAVKLRSKQIAVAVLTDAWFDATRVDAGTVCVGDARTPSARSCTEAHGRGHLKDVNGDGRRDMLLHYDLGSTGISQTTVEVCLVGGTVDGVPFKGCQAVSVR